MLIEGPILAERPRLTSPPVELPMVDEGALIGPHAVIHLAEVMRERLGERDAAAVLASAQIDALPDGKGMIPEIEALRAHRWLLLAAPVEGFDIAREAARRTADYIIANRIPAFAASLLRALPARLAAPMLMSAIGKHAWTFIGAGRFEPHGAWAFTIDRSKADDGLPVPDSTFDWYGAVFERLYQRLVSPDCRIVAQPVHGPSEPVRRFSIRRRQRGQSHAESLT